MTLWYCQEDGEPFVDCKIVFHIEEMFFFCFFFAFLLLTSRKQQKLFSQMVVFILLKVSKTLSANSAFGCAGVIALRRFCEGLCTSFIESTCQTFPFWKLILSISANKMPGTHTFFSSLWASLWDFMIQILSKLIIIQRLNVRVYMHCSMSITLRREHSLGSILHFSAVFFLLPWMMRQAWVTWHGVELLLQLYWNLMETWPSKTSTQGINFYASLRIAQCSHYFNRLKTNETIKRVMKLLRLRP